MSSISIRSTNLATNFSRNMNRMWNKCHIDLKHTILYVGWDFQVFDLVYYNGMHIMSLLMTAIETKKMIDDKKK